MDRINKITKILSIYGKDDIRKLFKINYRQIPISSIDIRDHYRCVDLLDNRFELNSIISLSDIIDSNDIEDMMNTIEYYDEKIDNLLSTIEELLEFVPSDEIDNYIP